ncbi:MAG: hypothetical protein KGY60_08070 [Bacteroidales bacterium]|nr:hypothetical protein [Bacteroidales bacterium]
MLSTLGFSQQRDSTLRFFGNLYDSRTYRPIEYAHIINISGNNATISDSLGTFDLKIEPGDSLMITSIGYQTTYYQYKDSLQKVVFRSIPIDEQVYAISGVEVTPWGTYRDFKRKFLSLDIKDPQEDVHPLLWEGINREPELKEEQINPGITSPITMIYSLFSKEIQSKQKLRELQRAKTKEDRLNEKFNREQVSALTGLEGERLERFMNYCNFSEEYILNTREYFILERVKKSYQQFIRLDSLHQLRQK